MAAAPIVTDLPIERPSENGSHFTEPWLEPFLIKHSSWYRRHLTKVGRRESHASRSSRNSSVATTTVTESVPRKASVDEDEQWQRVEEEYSATASEHEREKRTVEV